MQQFENYFSIDGKSHQKLNAYVSQQNNAVAHPDSLTLERKRGSLQRSPRQIVEKDLQRSVSPDRTPRESALASLNAGHNRSDAFSN